MVYMKHGVAAVVLAVIVSCPVGVGLLRQLRTIIVVRLRSGFFIRLDKLSAGRLTPVKRNLCKLVKNMQANVRQKRKLLIVRCCLNVSEIVGALVVRNAEIRRDWQPFRVEAEFLRHRIDAAGAVGITPHNPP